MRVVFYVIASLALATSALAQSSLRINGILQGQGGGGGSFTGDASDITVPFSSPTNYTEASADIDGHLIGIDSALGTMSSPAGTAFLGSNQNWTGDNIYSGQTTFASGPDLGGNTISNGFFVGDGSGLTGLVVSALGAYLEDGAQNLAPTNPAMGHTTSSTNGIISGGSSNTLNGLFVTIGGGQYNMVGGSSNASDFAVVAGGFSNKAMRINDTVGGGQLNTASGRWSVVSGGTQNQALFDSCTVGGGRRNVANASRATVAGGNQGLADGQYAAVGGGHLNQARGAYSVVVGGLSNRVSASGDLSFAAGSGSIANHEGAFVWSDSDYSAVSATSNEFVIAAGNGLRLTVQDYLPPVPPTNSVTIFGIDTNGSVQLKAYKHGAGAGIVTNLDISGAAAAVAGEQLRDFAASIQFPTNETIHIGPLVRPWTITQMVSKIQGGSMTFDLGGQLVGSDWDTVVTAHQTNNVVTSNLTVSSFSDPSYTAGEIILLDITTSTATNAIIAMQGFYTVAGTNDQFSYQFYEPTIGDISWVGSFAKPFVMTGVVAKIESGSATFDVIEQNLTDPWDTFTTNNAAINVTSNLTDNTFADNSVAAGKLVGFQVTGLTGATNLAITIQGTK